MKFEICLAFCNFVHILKTLMTNVDDSRNVFNDSDPIVYTATKDFKIKNLTTETYLDEGCRNIFGRSFNKRTHFLSLSSSL